MELMQAVKTRRSVRAYKDKPIPKEALLEIAEAGRFAATARNIQPWEFVVVTDPDILKKIASVAETGRFIAQAKACIAIFSADTKYYLEDGCAATENMLLAATALKIGSCWVAGDKKPYCPQICEILKAPAQFKLVSLIALGYPESDEVFRAADKRELDKMIHWEKF
jgi:nitroreductase